VDRGADEQPSSRSAAIRSVRAFVEHPRQGSCGVAPGSEVMALQAGLLEVGPGCWLGGRQVQSVSWSSGRRASETLAEHGGQALCAGPGGKSAVAAAAGGSRRAAWSRSAARAPWSSWSVGRLESCRNSPPRRTAKNSGCMVGRAMSAEGPSPRPNTSLEPTRSGRQRKPGLRHAVHHLSPGLRRLPPRAAQLER